MEKNPTLNIRITRASPDDAPLVLRLVKALAEYERMSHRVVATEAMLCDALAGPRPMIEVVIAYLDADPVGFAVFFPSFSTFAGTPGVFLEDLFVEPQWRGHGFGRRLLAHVAMIAVSRGWTRLNWNVLQWNESAIQFYRGVGAEPVKDWMGFGLAGEALAKLAHEAAAAAAERAV